MLFPKEMRGPSCTHEPTEWTECARCIEDYYLGHLTTERSLRAQVRGQITSATTAMRAASTLLGDAPEPADEGASTPIGSWVDALKGLPIEEVAWHFMERYDTVKLDEGTIERARQRHPAPAEPRPFTRLRELVEVQESPATPGVWLGRGKVFSVLKNRPSFTGATPDEVVENVLLAVLNELETQKAALEIRAALAEDERDALKARAALDAAAWKSADEVLDETRCELYQERQARAQAERTLAGFRARRFGAGALAATAPKSVDGRPCWCQVDWRGVRPSNHGDVCERLTALLQEMKKEEEKQP